MLFFCFFILKLKILQSFCICIYAKNPDSIAAGALDRHDVLPVNGGCTQSAVRALAVFSPGLDYLTHDLSRPECIYFVDTVDTIDTIDTNQSARYPVNIPIHIEHLLVHVGVIFVMFVILVFFSVSGDVEYLIMRVSDQNQLERIARSFHQGIVPFLDIEILDLKCVEQHIIVAVEGDPLAVGVGNIGNNGNIGHF